MTLEIREIWKRKALLEKVGNYPKLARHSTDAQQVSVEWIKALTKQKGVRKGTPGSRKPSGEGYKAGRNLSGFCKEGGADHFDWRGRTEIHQEMKLSKVRAMEFRLRRLTGTQKISRRSQLGSIPGSGRSPGGGSGNPLQYCLGNPMDRGARQATVQGVTRVTHDLATKPPPRSTSVKWEKCVFQNNNSDGYQEKMV